MAPRRSDRANFSTATPRKSTHIGRDKQEV